INAQRHRSWSLVLSPWSLVGLCRALGSCPGPSPSAEAPRPERVSRDREPRTKQGLWTKKHDGLADDGLTAADGSDVLTGLGLDVDPCLNDAQQSCEVRSDRRLVLRELGLLGVDDHVAIDDPPTGPLDPLDHLRQEPPAVQALPLRIRV